jgi:ammonia channel protein AmtB
VRGAFRCTGDGKDAFHHRGVPDCPFVRLLCPTLGASSGAIAALVAITPSCGAVTPLAALAIGGAAGAVCYFAVSLKYKLGFDDALDVTALHFIGGVVGGLLIGILSTPEAPSGAAGLFYGGGFELLGRQAVAILAVFAYGAPRAGTRRSCITWLRETRQRKIWQG